MNSRYVAQKAYKGEKRKEQKRNDYIFENPNNEMPSVIFLYPLRGLENKKIIYGWIL